MDQPAPPADAARPAEAGLRPRAAHSLPNPVRGLALAREPGRVLAWDDRDWIYLMAEGGRGQGQVHRPGLSTACAADDGSAYVAAGAHGEVWWLGPDLMPRWERAVSQAVVGAALDPLGQYVAVADTGSRLHLFDRTGRTVWHVEAPRPLHHLAFVPGAALVLACSDYGLVAGFDAAGRCTWRDGLVSHVGSLAVTGTGDRILLACFSDGLQQYSLAGRRLDRLSVGEPVRLAAVAFDGRLTLAVTVTGRLVLLTPDGQVVGSHVCDQPVRAAALAALADYAVLALGDGRLVWLSCGRWPVRAS